MTISESLLQIAELTKKNLQILEVLNNSFYTKSNHLSTVVGDTTYTIPSYIALENKVNHLQDAFNNLVHAAKSGEAWFNFNGNSKEVLVRGYQQAPNPIKLTNEGIFSAEVRSMFKDMLTPQPYLDFDMSVLPDDITQVVVKKVIPYKLPLLNQLKAQCPKIASGNAATEQLSWSSVVRCLGSGDPDYIAGVDYLEYETTYTLPIRRNTKSGTYVIEQVLDDQITEKLENILTLKIHEDTPLTTIGFDGTTIEDLSAGDELITYDGSAKLKIRTIKPAARTIEVLVMSGEYVNAIGAGKDIAKKDGQTILDVVSDYSKLRLYSSVEGSRRLHIPLEEDKYVYIAVAPLNPRLNIQTEWGEGIFVEADSLHKDKIDGGQGFRDYYNQNVTNIGDAITEFANIMYPAITKFSTSEMAIMQAAPVNCISENTLKVVQINKHLNDSDAVKNIRALYSQKKQYQTDLNEVQSKIQSLTDELAQISFDDMSGVRSAYTAQITDLKDQQNNLVTSINKIIDSIAISANNAEVPIEEGKFRIRGYVDVESFLKEVTKNLGDTVMDMETARSLVLGVECRYRYKNADIPQANVSVIGDFLFTEWSQYNPPLRERSMHYSDGKYNLTQDDVDTVGFRSTDNVPKFNQIDVPITQGEIVELQVRILWGYGYPFVKTATAWSESIEVKFPPELVKDVQVTTIIEENNSDIETNRFEKILSTKGITQHVDDSIDDQDVKYFHKPESISSGFYTPERRIIPLKDKLLTMSNDILEVQDLLKGTTSEALKVNLVVDGVANLLQADITNVIQLPAYNQIPEAKKEVPTGSAYKKDKVAYIMGMITITNITEHTVRLYSMFPAGRDKFISGISTKTSTYFQSILPEFVNGKNAVGILWPSSDDGGGDPKYKMYEPRGNQIITYRLTNPYTKDLLNAENNEWDHWKTIHNEAGDAIAGYPLGTLWVQPMATTKFGMCFDSDAVNSNKVIAPGQSVSFPIAIDYKMDENIDNKATATRTIGFNIRNSLYTDPLYYEVQLVAKYNQSLADALLSSKASVDDLTSYNVTVR